jgi:hypothetical protein
MIVDAVHKNPLFNVTFPSAHDAQKAIAKDFEDLSQAGFYN